MDETNDVVVAPEVVDEGKVNDGKVDMTGAGADNRPASQAEETAGQDTSGKDVKTTPEAEVATEDSGDKEIEDALKKGADIPYERFHSWNEGKVALKTENGTLKAENEGMAELLNNPSVFKAVLQGKGITDPKILAEKMKEAGFEVDEQTDKTEDELFNDFSKGLDLNSPKDWFKLMKRMNEYYVQEGIKPIEGKLSNKEVQEWVSSQESEAKKVAKDNYGLEYGISGKDEGNPNTAIGKMSAYLSKHPEDARLGHVKILRLALSEDGVKLGEKKGEAKEKQRNDSLKRSAMEDDAQTGKDELPNKDMSVSQLMAWRRTHGK